MTAADKKIFAALRQSELEAFTAPTTTLETVRGLHVLYGIAMTNRLTQPEPAISDAYRVLAGDIHTILDWITGAHYTAVWLRWLLIKWNDAADMSDDDRVTALYGSWAQNVKSIT